MNSGNKEQIRCLTSLELLTNKKEAFNCPSCGNNISPDDTSEKAYSILEIKVNASGLEEMVICCKKCGRQINLTGFPSNTRNQATGKEASATEIYYFTHI